MLLLSLFLLIPGVYASSETLPDWFLPLRDAIYEQQLTADEIEPLYREISSRARFALSGADLYIALSRCEYMMGRAYQYEDRKNEAITRYDEGIKMAERALEIKPSAEAWVMLAENISQSCVVRPVSYAMTNGLKVEKYAKNALALDSKNAAAKILIAVRWVYAPSPFNNYRKGIEMLSVIPNESNMEKDDMFNTNLAISYAHIQRKNSAEGRHWLQRALELYPTNKFAQSLKNEL